MTRKPVVRHEVVQPSDPTIRYIPLTQGYVTVVDADDYDFLTQWTWKAKKDSHTIYVHRRYRIGGRKRKWVQMHRVLLNAPPNCQVDHIDHDGLNNTRANLRLATSSQNQYNRSQTKGKGYKGVHERHDGRPKKFRAAIWAEGVETRIGSFKTAENAATAYNIAALRLHGEFALLNK
jgi:hypothetical protein